MSERKKAFEPGITHESKTFAIVRPGGDGVYVTATKDEQNNIVSIGVVGDGEEAAWMRVWASVTSIAIQHGAPVKKLLKTSGGHRIGDPWFTPVGRVNGVLDAACRWLATQLEEE